MFLGLEFSADGVLGLWVFWSSGSLYKHLHLHFTRLSIFEWIYTIYTTKSTWGSKYFSTLNPSKSEPGFGTDY